MLAEMNPPPRPSPTRGGGAGRERHASRDTVHCPLRVSSPSPIRGKFFVRPIDFSGYPFVLVPNKSRRYPGNPLPFPCVVIEAMVFCLSRSYSSNNACDGQIPKESHGTSQCDDWHVR